MTILDLYPPITAAGIVAGLWLLVSYRFFKSAVPGNETIMHAVWLGLLPISALAFLYFQRSDPVTSWFGVFMTTLLSLGMAGAWFYGLRLAFFTQGLKPFARWYIRIGVAFLAWMYLGFPFT